MARCTLLSAMLLAASSTACTAPNPEYCASGPTFADCVRLRLGIEGPPDLTGYQVVPLPDMTPGPDLFQCIAPGEHCSDNGLVRPGACCGNYVCLGTCRAGLHGACTIDGDCAPIIVGKDRSPATCFGGQCLSQSGGVCALDSDCASGACNNAIARCR